MLADTAIPNTLLTPAARSGCTEPGTRNLSLKTHIPSIFAQYRQ